MNILPHPADRYLRVLFSPNVEVSL